MKYKLRLVRRNIKMILLSSFLIFLVLVSFSYKTSLTFYLNGSTSIRINLFQSYEEKGATAYVCSFFDCFDVSSSIAVLGSVDETNLGNYKLEYKLKYGIFEKSLYRFIEVIDEEVPSITLKGSSKVFLNLGQEYLEEGYVAIDNYDGDITNQVIKEVTGQCIYYRVQDSSGNWAEVKRDIVYKNVKTEKQDQIWLKGDPIVYLEAGSVYRDEGVMVLNENVVVNTEGLEAFDKAGEYEIVYTAHDEMGNGSVLKRTIYVYDFTTKDKDLYQLSLNYYLQYKGYNVSIGYENLTNDSSYFYQKDKIYYGASLIKTLDAMYVYEKMELTPFLKDCVEQAISISSNRCHIKLVETIGFYNLKQYGKNIGATHVLTRGSDDYFGNTNVSDQIIYMRYLYNLVNTHPLGGDLKGYFINDHYNYISFDGSPTVMHKYGYYGKFFHESAIVLDQNPYVIVLLSEEANHDYPTIFNDLSEKIYGFHKLT